jgi:hypothetical protein
MKRKCVVIGIILLFMGAGVTVGGESVQNKTMLKTNAPTFEHTPGDGVYWNNHKIAEYPVPLFLHYYFRICAIIPITLGFEASEGLDRIEIYINELLQETIIGPGPAYSWAFNVIVTPFHHSPTFGIKLYHDGGEIISDNVTIYRLFP